MRPSIVFIDRAPGRVIERPASAAKARGLDAVFVCPPGTRFERPEVFAEIVHGEDWTRDGLRRVVEEIGRRRDIRGLSVFYGFFHDGGLLGADVAALAAERGLPSMNASALYRANNKYLTREALRAAGVLTVDFGIASDEESAVSRARRIGFPVLLKPIAGLGSSLIFKCNDEAELRSNLKTALERLPKAFYSGFFAKHSFEGVDFDPRRSMLVEKYIAGREASVECVVGDGEAIPLLVHDKVVVEEGAKVVYENVLVVPPARFTARETARMKAYAKRCIAALGLRNTLCHVELRYSDDGPQLLEVNPRLGGMRVADSLKTMLGFDARDAQVALAVGEFRPVPWASRKEMHAMFALYPNRGGVLGPVEGLEAARGLDGILSLDCHYAPGTKIAGDDEECFLVSGWMKARSLEHVLSTHDAVRRAVRYEVA